MRFAAPRSLSPSPVRSSYRKSTFGVSANSSDDDSSDSDSESLTSSSSSDDAFCYESGSEVSLPPLRPRRAGCSLAEHYATQDTVAAIRLRMKHHDVYEEWERQTRKDAFLSARREQSAKRAQRHVAQDKAHSQEAQRLADLYAKQMEEVQAQLAAIELKRKTEDQKMKHIWGLRNRRIRERIEGVIKFEEDKVAAKLEEERKKKEEEERKKKVEEERIRQEAEKKQQEEEKRQREEEERRRQKEIEDTEEKQRLEEEQQRLEQENAEEREMRTALGFTTMSDDWRQARQTLLALKAGPMTTVKADPTLKAMWNAGRRQIIPKVGQLTNDGRSIFTITQQVVEIVRPASPQPLFVYIALLSSLAKAILLQAETEVTAEKRSAGPLAQVTANLLCELENFAEIFWAKLCQRAGPWPIPGSLPKIDIDGTPFTDEQRTKMSGQREGESMAEYGPRVAGLMRVYFGVLFAPVANPLDPLFRLPRYWTYFARIFARPRLLEHPVASQVLYAALDVGGSAALDVWGGQWVKILELLYDGVTVGLSGDGSRLIGGPTPEGTAARVRVQLEIERIMSNV